MKLEATYSSGDLVGLSRLHRPLLSLKLSTTNDGVLIQR
jgi:hypothetical protein